MSQNVLQDDVPVPDTVEENSRDPSTIDEDAALLVRAKPAKKNREMKLK